MTATGSPCAGGGAVNGARHASWLARTLWPSDAGGADRDIAALAAEMRAVTIAAGTSLFCRGEPPRAAYIVRDGTVELSLHVGNRRSTAHVLTEGDVFGDLPMLLRSPEWFDARLLDDSVLLCIDSLRLAHLLSHRPRLSQWWLLAVAKQAAGANERLMELLAGSLRPKSPRCCCTRHATSTWT